MLLKDTRGKESITLTLVVVSVVVVWVKFAFSGLTLGAMGALPPMDGIEFGTAIGALLGVWWGREHTEKTTCMTAGRDSVISGEPIE